MSAARGQRPSAGAHLAAIFAQSAARVPEATALVWQEERLSYGELARRVFRLARHLQSLGVGPEERVALALERGPDLVTAMLAVLCAGGAYVPLDPAYPSRRTALILEDSAPAVMIARHRRESSARPVGIDPPLLVDPERDRDAIARCSAAPLEPGSGAENLAYLIYTSGSTGLPKGVAIPHRAAANLVRWAARDLPRADLAAMLAATSINFDLSVFELFVPFHLGGKVILADNVLALPRLEAAAEVRFVNTVPSAMAELARAAVVPATVRSVGLAGEILHGALAERVHEILPRARLFNLYGPSETTTYSTWEEVPRGAPKPFIGRPVAATGVHLLDDALCPVGAGERGELHLSGAGLARGYLGRPRQTAESFLPHPAAGVAEVAPGARLYRTGDLARFVGGEDGAEPRLDFLGRRDHQVKVRGFRIELGEIDAALERLPAVRTGAVLARERAEEMELVAYVVPEGAAPAVGELRAALGDLLPAYMVPQHFVFLAEMPHTPSGKIDHRALPAQPALTPRARPYRAPRNAVERTLAEILEAVLGREGVGLDDDFLALGGHSIAASRAAGRIAARLGVEVSPNLLFEQPTVEKLAARLASLPRKAPAVGKEVGAGEARPGDERQLPQSSAQRGMWFFDRFHSGESTYNVPLLLRLDGRLEPPALAAALAAVVRRHQALRTTFALDAGEPVQRISAPRPPPELPIADLGALPEKIRRRESGRSLARVTRRPFDLAADPLLRAVVLRLGEENHALCLVLHHIVTDDASHEILLRELAALYGAAVSGRPSPLPALPAQYAGYTLWLRRREEEGFLAGSLDYWRRQLAGASPALDLPRDRPRPPFHVSRGERRAARWPLAAGLDALARSHGASRFMVAMTALEALLWRHGGQDDLILGTPVELRPRPEFEVLIGCFLNFLPLRFDLAGDPSFAELLHRTRRVCLAAQAHRGVPFDRLLELLEAPHGRLPVEVALIWEEVAVPPRLAPGLELSFSELDNGGAKFDLAFYLTARGADLAAELEYNRGLFERATADRLLRQYGVLLEAALADPEQPLSRLPLAGEPPRPAARHTAPAPAAPPAVLERRPRTSPRRGLEERLAALWAEILSHSVAEIGAEDDFFQLGGHSLLATRMLWRLPEAAPDTVEISLERFAARPTIRALAAAIEAEAAGDGELATLRRPLRRASRQLRRVEISPDGEVEG